MNANELAVIRATLLRQYDEVARLRRELRLYHVRNGER